MGAECDDFKNQGVFKATNLKKLYGNRDRFVFRVEPEIYALSGG